MISILPFLYAKPFINSKGSKFFPFGVDLFLKEDKTNLDRVTSLKNVFNPLYSIIALGGNHMLLQTA